MGFGNMDEAGFWNQSTSDTNYMIGTILSVLHI